MNKSAPWKQRSILVTVSWQRKMQNSKIFKDIQATNLSTAVNASGPVRAPSEHRPSTVSFINISHTGRFLEVRCALISSENHTQCWKSSPWNGWEISSIYLLRLDARQIVDEFPWTVPTCAWLPFEIHTHLAPQKALNMWQNEWIYLGQP